MVDLISALEADDLDAVKTIPKSDLHRHCAYGTQLENLEIWIGGNLRRSPEKMNGLSGMMEYASESIDPHITNLEAFRFVAESAIQDAVADGVTVLEMSFDIRSSRHFPLGVDDFCDFITSLQELYSETIDLRPELGIARGLVQHEDISEKASALLDTGVFLSIDLYGLDEECEPEMAKSLYDRARNLGMKLKAHVGEFGDNAEDVRKTVELLGLDAIQHGIAAAHSKEVMGWLSDRQVHLNVCPTSNVRLNAVRELQEHPIRSLLDNGVIVTVNSDDPMIFGVGVSDEYLALYRSGVLTAAEIEEIRMVSLTGSLG